MGALINSLANALGQFAAAIVGPLGILFVTIGIAGTIIGCMWFNVPWHYLWKVAILAVILLAAGVIATGLKTA